MYFYEYSSPGCRCPLRVLDIHFLASFPGLTIYTRAQKYFSCNAWVRVDQNGKACVGNEARNFLIVGSAGENLGPVTWSWKVWGRGYLDYTWTNWKLLQWPWLYMNKLKVVAETLIIHEETERFCSDLDYTWTSWKLLQWPWLLVSFPGFTEYICWKQA